MIVAIGIALLDDVIVAGLHPHPQLLGVVPEIKLGRELNEVLFDLLVGVDVAESARGVRIDVGEDVGRILEGDPVAVEDWVGVVAVRLAHR